LLKYGIKKELSYEHIEDSLLNSFERKDLLEKIERIFLHKGFVSKVKNISLVKSENSRKGSINNKEEWLVETNDPNKTYILSNFNNASTEYSLAIKK
jgi:hypothetical protein